MPETVDTSILSYTRRRPADQKAGMEPVAHSVFLSTDAADAKTAFQNDERNIQDSPAFRKLVRNTMMVPLLKHSVHNRSSHCQNVAAVGVRIANALELDATSEALVRAIALGHDIGHPPFSHEGEAVLQRRLAKFGIDWDHDTASLQRLLKDENHDIGHDGLPLTVATVEGIAKRHWRYENHADHRTPTASPYQHLPARVLEIEQKHNLHLQQWNHAEGQIAATADWISATVTDIKDMVDMKLKEKNPAIATKEFFDALKAHFPLAKSIADQVTQEFTDIIRTSTDEKRRSLKGNNGTIHSRVPALVKKFGERLEKAMIDDVVQHTRNALQHYSAQNKIRYADDIRTLDHMLISPSPELRGQLNELKKFYHTSVYNKIKEANIDQERMVEIVFDDFASGNVKMPANWDKALNEIHANKTLDDFLKQRETAQLIAHYISANMSDGDVIGHVKQHHYEEVAKIFAKPKPPTSIINPPNAVRGAASPESICDELRILQNAHRLGMHIWEEHNINTLPEEAQKALSHTPAEAIEATARAGKMPFLSMSLLPATNENRVSIIPYSGNHGRSVTLGYVLDLSQNRPDRAIIPRIYEGTLASGADSLSKQFSGRDIHYSEVPELRLPPLGIDSKTSSEESIKKALIDRACASEGAAFTGKQLDALGQYLQSKPERLHMHHHIRGEASDAVLAFNELLVGASQKHIKAIMVAVYPDEKNISNNEYMARVKLHGAIAGLAHIEKGIELPVLYYNVKPPQQGELTWLGQGQDDLRRKAIEAIRVIQKHHPQQTSTHFPYTDADQRRSIYTSGITKDQAAVYPETIKALTGIDIDRPVDQQIHNDPVVQQQWTFGKFLTRLGKGSEIQK